VSERQARGEVQRLADELQAANRKLLAYADQAEELAITRERARLAHELRDIVGHTLTALDVQLALLSRLPPGQTELSNSALRLRTIQA
jgi:signal transduction histidine kinase